MPNIVEITVRSINGTKPIFDQVRRDAGELGADVGENIADESSRRLREEATSNSGGFARAGDAIGDAIGRRVSDRVNQRLRDSRGRFISAAGGSDGGRGGEGGRGGQGGAGGRDGGVDVDVDRPSLLQRFFNLGKEAGSRIVGGIQSSLSSTLTGVMSGDFISMILKGLTVASIAYALGPVLGAGITAALGLALGGGVIGAGIAAAFQDPIIKGSVTKLGQEMKVEFAKFGEYFNLPVTVFLEKLKQDLIPQVKPIIDRLGAVFAPVTANLGTGLIGFIQNALPRLSRFIEDSAPLWDTLSESLPGLGEDIGYFFDKLREGIPAANVFLNDFISGVGWIIRRLGDLIMWLSFAYTGIRSFFIDLARAALKAFGLIINGAADAFGWMPGLGPKLQAAAGKFNEFRKKVNSELDKIEDENVKVTITQVFKTVGTIVAGVAREIGGQIRGNSHGGIIGAASGGIRGGLTWVGENGPELVRAAPGSHVYSNPDSMRMMNSGGSSQPLVVQLLLDGRVVQEVLVEPTRQFIQQRFGGNVQLAYGNGS